MAKRRPITHGAWNNAAALLASVEKMTTALDAIHALLDGQEWTPETVENVAFILTRYAGYTIRDSQTVEVEPCA